MATKVKKQPRRIILATGHPWFYSEYAGKTHKIAITKERNGLAVNLRVPANIGNWNKVRLVLEVIK